ncbi:MAG TPA: hypothetical protein DCO79_00425 [Spirochaeta sp.]|nr:hypothetical protein [Spirochaeta sp.]
MIISLYIHIPFCRTKCDYCDFFSVPSSDRTLQKAVLDSIIHELKTELNKLDEPKIETIFIGGGTPSSIQPSEFYSFLTALNEIIAPIKNEGCEFSTEANIASCTKDFMSAAEDGGINRLSIGVQSFDHQILGKIGRICPVDDIYGTAAEIRSYWQESFSMDLISGITDDYLTDIELALKLEPHHLSVYQLSIEKETPLYSQIAEGKKKAPDDLLQSEAISEISSLLKSEGWERYEISNYAKNGNYCRHNIRYWNMQSYLGIGPSAVSSIYFKDSGLRTTNTANLEQYINNENREIENLTRADFMIEHYLMGLRLSNGVDNDIFHSRFGKSPSEFIPSTAAAWAEQGMFDIKKSRLNDRGQLFLDSFLSEVYDELTGTT